jgi:hypothetical protein
MVTYGESKLSNALDGLQTDTTMEFADAAGAK